MAGVSTQNDQFVMDGLVLAKTKTRAAHKKMHSPR